MRVLYLSGAEMYKSKLREVNNTYRAKVFGSLPGVTVLYPSSPLDVFHLVANASPKPNAVFISDPWHNFWDPCVDYPNCPSLYTRIANLDELDVAVIIESGDSQFYYEETVELLRGIRRSGVAIRSKAHHWRFANKNKPIFYLPHGAYAEMRQADSVKLYDVLFSGSEHPDSYPVRSRVATALRNTKHSMSVDWLPHPSDKQHDVIGPKFWPRVAQSRLAVAGTNAFACLTMRYLEIPASGSLAIGDVPNEAECLEEFMGVIVRPGMSPFDIRDAIVAAVHAPDYQTRVAAACRHAFAHHSFESHAKRVLAEIETELLCQN